MRRMEQRAKRRAIAARIYTALLIICIAALYHWTAAVMLFLLMCSGYLGYNFLRYVKLMGNLDEDLREL